MPMIRFALRTHRRDRQRILCHLSEKHAHPSPPPLPLSNEEAWFREARRTTEAKQILNIVDLPKTPSRPSRPRSSRR